MQINYHVVVVCVAEQTPIQLELSLVNNRYDALAQRVASVKKDRQTVADCVQDIVQLHERLEEQGKTMPHIHPVPIVETEARDKLKLVAAYNKDLLANEGRVAGVKVKAEQLLQGREHAPETKALRRQLRKLGNHTYAFTSLVAYIRYLQMKVV